MNWALTFVRVTEIRGPKVGIGGRQRGTGTSGACPGEDSLFPWDAYQRYTSLCTGISWLNFRHPGFRRDDAG